MLTIGGGFGNNPADHGVTNKLGITAARLAHRPGVLVTQADVRVMQPGVGLAIYRVHHWNKVRGGELPDSVDLAVFDVSIHSSPC